MNAPRVSYDRLRERVDRLCGEIWTRLRDQFSCRPGCSACCRHLSLFPVEADVVRSALMRLDTALLRRLVPGKDPDACPLLLDGLCVIYRDRPLICRTHGFPLIVRQGGDLVVDRCPLNFTGVETLSGDHVLDLDRINVLLASINHLHVSSLGNGRDARIPIRQIVDDVRHTKIGD